MAHVAKYKASALGRMCGHYERRAERHGYERENVDNSLTDRNYNLMPERPQGQVAWITDRIGSLGLKRKPRSDAVRMCDVVVTAPPEVREGDERRFFEAESEALGRVFGRGNCVSAWVHGDEPHARWHMHWAFVPVTADGRLSAKDVVSRNALRQLHPALQRAADEALGYHVQVQLDDGRRAAEYVGLDEYKRAAGEAARAKAGLAEARAEAEGWARLSRALGPTGDGADVPQEDGSVRHQDSVGQLVTQRETMRAEAEMQLELARRARQQAETELSEARQEASKARAEAKRAREDAEAAKSAQRAAEGAREAVQRDVAALEGQRAATKRLAAEEYQRHLRVKSDNLLAEAAQTLRREEGPAVTRDGLEGVWRDFSRAVADVALDWWRDARDYARELWQSWRHGEWGGRTADRLGIDRRDAGGMADEALEDAGVERGEAEAAADLLAGPTEPLEEYRHGL